MKRNGKLTSEAHRLFQKKEFEAAEAKFIEAIEHGEYESTSMLALMYITGYGAKQDIDKGLEYLFLGDKHNDPESISALADYYYNGKYVEKNLDKARAYYKRAADLEEPHAVGMLGLFLFNEE